MKEFILYIIIIIGAVAIWNVETIAFNIQSASQWSEPAAPAPAIQVAATENDFQAYPEEEELYMDMLPVIDVHIWNAWDEEAQQIVYQSEFVYLEKNRWSTLQFFSEVSFEEMIEDINYHFNINQPLLCDE